MSRAAPIRGWISRLLHGPAKWIVGLLGYEIDLDATCDFCGAKVSYENAIRHIRTFHPAEAEALEPKWPQTLR